MAVPVTNVQGGSPNRLTPKVIDLEVEHMGGEHLGSKTPPYFELLTPVEFAERLKVPVTWVRERTRSRELRGDVIPHVRLGRYIRYKWGSPELEAWLRRRMYSGSQDTTDSVC